MAASQSRARGFALFLAFALAGAGVDLFTKHVVFQRLASRGEVTLIDGFLGFVLSRNPGAAFSMLVGQINFFLLISVAALVLLAYFSLTAKPPSWRYQLALGTVGAGVLGNLHDRVRFHAVRDFIKVSIDYPPIASRLDAIFNTHTWPIFNVADSFICVGAGALIVKYWIDERRERVAAKAAAGGRG
jgi:signal peptidase II